MGNGYCPRCNKNVFTQRDMDTGTIIFLLCCCGVVPGLICLVTELSKPENICTICNGITEPIRPSSPAPIYIKREEEDIDSTVIEGKKFCQQCGAEISEDQRFCQGCGAEL